MEERQRHQRRAGTALDSDEREQQCSADGREAEVGRRGPARLYGQLAQLVPSGVVELNRAVAVAMADGPAAGLELVDALLTSEALPGYYLLPATRGDLLRRSGQAEEAAASYHEALELATTDAERRFLARRLTETTGSSAQEREDLSG
ncbi:MAG: hypothetical protein ACRD2C_14665 [Acidimicrobiales bacterium]